MNPAGKVRCNMRKQIELGRDDCNSAEPGDKCRVDQLAMTGRPAVEHDRRPKSRSVAPHTGGSGGVPNTPHARVSRGCGGGLLEKFYNLGPFSLGRPKSYHRASVALPFV